MKSVQIQGDEIPALGLGTWQIRGRQCRKTVSHGLSIGYRHIDTAQIYKNEKQVGAAIDDSSVDRDELFVTSKVWRDNVGHEDTIRSTEASLRRLQTDYIDLMLIHWPVPEVPFRETLDALLELKEQDKIRHFGVSNFTPAQVRNALDHTDLWCNQVEYHPYLDQSDLHELAVENDMLLTAYSPLARGEVMSDNTLRELGHRYGKSPAQITLRWLIQKESVAAVPKAASAEHREANIDIFDFELDASDIETIDKLASGRRLIDPSFAPDWE